ncbi:cytochrome c [Anaerolineales bacterium HSG6]|nr:cytochrome c [Anaerolineales bacterium HSG6]MDM8530943.1 cytochrome c [Anaerolineales bacterium HSG25]
MKKLFVFTIILSITLLLTTACGGSDPAPAPEEEAAPAEKAEEPAEEVAVEGDAEAGKTKFDATCIACHGPDGTGVPSLGSDLTTSEFTSGLSDAELIEFIKVGRASGASDNTTGIDMPPKGGNPSINDEDIANITAYMRTIQK